MITTKHETDPRWRVIAKPDGGFKAAQATRISPYVYAGIKVQYGHFDVATIDNLKAEMFAAHVADKYGYELAEIQTAKRDAPIAHIRHLIAYALAKHSNLTLNEIARLLHKKDHTTIIHSRNVVAGRKDVDEQYAMEVAEVLIILKQYS